MEFLSWLEGVPLSVWVRESPSLFAFPGILVLHTIGLAFLVGASAAIDFRLLGFASDTPLRPMERFFPVMWLGFAVNAVSGVILLVGYPTKALTNPLFYLKLGCIGAAVGIIVAQSRRVFGDPELDRKPLRAGGKLLAAASLLLWIAAITSGRLLAYTYTYLMAEDLLPWK